jgi:hypothetical protein
MSLGQGGVTRRCGSSPTTDGVGRVLLVVVSGPTLLAGSREGEEREAHKRKRRP